jgi:hypothetical protein
MYSIATRASRGNEDHMAAYFPLVMGKAPLLLLDNLPAMCITFWATLSRLFTTNYQVTYILLDNTHHLSRVRMRRDETLCEYTNRYFENRYTLAGVKGEDVIAYYKGITNIKLFEKVHKADAPTIGDLMAYVDKLIDTQDAVMHDFNREDHDDGGTRSHKRSGEAYVSDPSRPSTFVERDFNTVVMTATTGVTTTKVIVVMIDTTTSAMTDEMTDMMINVARKTTVTTTTTGRSELHRHLPKGQPQWCVSEGQPRDQLHRRWSPSDQKQPTNSIKR